MDHDSPSRPHASVFDRFHKGDKSRQPKTGRYTGGTGLGLSIVASIVHAHEGDVEILDDGRPGTTVRVTLPHRRRNTESG